MVKSKEKEEFIESNIPLVHSLCRRFLGRGVEYDDLFGAGCEGLVKAANRFDPQRGFSFSTYAVPVILGEIKRIFRDGGNVKVSRSVKELYLKITRVENALSEKLDRSPTVGEIAETLGVSVGDVSNAICAARSTVSLSSYNDQNTADIDIPEDDGDLLLDKIALQTALEILNEKERKIINLRYFKGFTQSETAKVLGETQVNISRTERKTLEKLRKGIKGL